MQPRQTLYFFPTCKKWAYLRHMLSVNTQTRLSMHEVCQSLHCSRTYKNGNIYGIFYQSMLEQTLACVQSHQSIHCSNTCTRWAYIRHIPSVNAQTRLSMRAVSPEPSLLSHMRKLGVHTAYSIRQYSDET